MPLIRPFGYGIPMMTRAQSIRVHAETEAKRTGRSVDSVEAELREIIECNGSGFKMPRRPGRQKKILGWTHREKKALGIVHDPSGETLYGFYSEQAIRRGIKFAVYRHHSGRLVKVTVVYRTHQLADTGYGFKDAVCVGRLLNHVFT